MNRPAFVSVALIWLITLPGRASAETPSGPAAPSARVAKQPPPRCVIAPIDLAVTPRISLNRLRTPCARNTLGLALGASKAGELRGLQIALGANAVERDMIGAQVALGLNAVGEGAGGLQIAGLVNAAGESFTGIQLAGLVNASGERVTALQLAGLGNAAGGRATGLQVAGLFNAAGDDVRGVQVAGLFNAAGEGVRGLQASLLFNAAGDHVRGLQASLLFNAAGDHVRGLQASLLFNAAGGDGRAVQVAGLFNAIGGPATAGQIAGLFNAAGELRGFQLSAGMNAVGRGEGLQAALAFNRARHDMTGVQLAAVNIGDHVAGAQVGLVNIARTVRGAQIGLVNVADRVDAPIGAVSWVRSGERALEVWSGEALALSAGVRLGTERVYSLVGLASGPLVDGNPWGPLAGAGVKGGRGRIGLLVDALAHGLFFDGADEQALLAQGRARVAMEVSERIAVTAGATWNVFVSGDRDGADLSLGGDSLDRSGDLAIRQWPGLTAGASLAW